MPLSIQGFVTRFFQSFREWPGKEDLMLVAIGPWCLEHGILSEVFHIKRQGEALSKYVYRFVAFKFG